MARPIKETPILKGNDAHKFIEHMSRSDERKETIDERNARMEIYEATLKMFTSSGKG